MNSVEETFLKTSEGAGDMSEDDRYDKNEEELGSVSLESVRRHLANSYGLDSSETEKIIETYAKVLQEYLLKLQQAVRGNDAEDGSAQAHGLKGACLNLGLPEQASRAEFLEKELAKNKPQIYIKEVEQLIFELRPLTDEV